MNKYLRQMFWITSWFILAVLFSSTGSSAEPPVSISLVADKAVYKPDEPIRIQVRVKSEINGEVISRKGFFSQDFYLMILFTDPDGKPVSANYLQGSTEPEAPYSLNDRGAALVEVIPPGAENTKIIDNARLFYPLTKPGRYTAQIKASLETFSNIYTDPDAGETDPDAKEFFAYLDDPDRQGFELVSNKISFEISDVPPLTSSIHVFVNLLEIGSGEKPKAKKTPLENIPVRLIRVSDIPKEYKPANYKTHSQIWDNVAPVGTGITDSKGWVRFDNIVRDDYIILALYNRSGEFRNMGGFVDDKNPNWDAKKPIRKDLTVMVKANSESVPGRTITMPGTGLLITEPEYIVWDGSQELYPIVIENTNNSKISTTVSLPKGLAAKHDSLQSGANEELDAVQFTLKNFNAHLAELEATYKIKTKTKTDTIKSRISVKCSADIAKKKGHEALCGEIKK